VRVSSKIFTNDKLLKEKEEHRENPQYSSWTWSYSGGWSAESMKYRWQRRSVWVKTTPLCHVVAEAL
jgi:2,3-bisphosphoglycerate-independent phosphoglycerate mutase